MSQLGSPERSVGSQPSSVTPSGSKPSTAPAKVPSDDEAEEGEIVDEEEGEIAQPQAPESAAPAAPVDQPAPADPSAQSASSEEPKANAERSAGKDSADASKDLDSLEATVATPPVEDAPTPAPSVQREAELVTKPDEQKPKEPEVQPETAKEAAAEEPTTPSTAREPEASEEAPAAKVAPSSITAIEPAQLEESAEKQPQPPSPQRDHTSAPELKVTATPSAETQAPGESRPQAGTAPIQASEAPNGPVGATDAPAASTAAAEPEKANGAEAASAPQQTEIQEPSSMDIDDNGALPAKRADEGDNKPVETTPKPEPMEVEDNIHTPALPVDDLADTAQDAERKAEVDEPTREAQEEPAPPATQVKSEPRADKPEEQPTKAAQPSQEAAPASVEAPRQQNDVAEQRTVVEQRAEAARLPPSAALSRRSRTPQNVADPAAAEARRAESAREAPSSPRLAEAEPLQTRPSRHSASTPSAQDRRIERSKERSHPPERSQEREQRAREKDRRRELERLERERERERERIRESERDREMMIARENEEARLIWLSLPGNDHPQYYTDTDSDSCYGAAGAHGAGVTDEEDKDLDPPLPLSLQEYHPAPSHSQSYFNDQYYASKRKRTDEDGDFASLRRHRRKPVSVGERHSWSSSKPVHRDALPSTAMIDIDDFPVPDSSIRGEPSDRPFASRIERASLPRHSPYDPLHDAADEFDSSDSDEEAMRIADERKRRHGNRSGNRGNKLSRDKGSRWVRRGKLGGWTEMRMDKEIGDRVRHRVEAMQKDNVRALLSAMPDEDKAMLAQFPALRDGLIPSEAHSARRDARGRILPSDLSEAARIDAELGLDGSSGGASGSRLARPEHLTSTSLAPTLLKPAVTPRQLLTSHTLRHTFRNPHIAALGKTALDLIESEGVLGRAVGRCWAAMERGGWNEDPEPKGDAHDGDEPDQNGMDVDGSDADSSARDPDDTANGASGSDLFGSAVDNPALSHLDKLFVTKQGLAIPRLDDMGQPIFVPPSPSTQAARAEAGLPEESANEAVIETTLLPAPEQRSIVLAALECLHDLAADSREYVERLEEVRSRLAAVKRRRAQVWTAVRQWALDKDVEASVAHAGNSVAADMAGAPAAAAAAAAVTSAVARTVTNGSSPKKRK
ncbi:hypothetical protein L1887_55630 [Cichorium endivia]|nr:hypothetical protein L1887_55630 [Cichorium endivia]